MAKLVSKTYGEALFELAHEENKASEMLEEIQSVREILKSNPEFRKMMLHPGIAKQDKLKKKSRNETSALPEKDTAQTLGNIIKTL